MSPVLGSRMASARVVGMRLRAQSEIPTATTEHMPFKGHRTCAEWEPLPGRRFFGEHQQTDEERVEDAVNGSTALRKAIIKASARK